MTSQTFVIYHNPGCSTSRKALAVLREGGGAVEVIDYLKVGWTRAALLALLDKLHMGPRGLLRTKEALAKSLGLDRAEASADEILDAMIAHPVLVERPIVIGPKGGAICRPLEVVRTLL